MEAAEPKVLDINEKLNTSYCIPLWLRDEKVRASIARIKGRIGDELPPGEQYKLRTDPIAVAGFGPSLNDTWKKIKKFKYVITCSGAHKFLVERGVIPTWHIDVDPRPHKADLIGAPHKDVQYLIASTCDQKLFDHLEGFNVKLWHIFANEEDALRTLPRGEWALTGGSSAGLRTISVARFLGFTNLHIFGLDGSFGKSGQHADKHPNQPPGQCITTFKGVDYYTTPAVLECGKQTFHELDSLPDVKATFYGDGLVQAMAKDYKPKPMRGTVVAFNKPELISEELRELNARLHRDNLGYGVGGGRHAPVVMKMITKDIQSVLDYGCGKSYLQKALSFPIWQYDPAIPEFSESPRPADLVCCFDVLEHVEPDKIQFVLDDLRRCVKKVGYFVIHLKAAVKTYADGRNTHLLVQSAEWWERTLSKFFEVAKTTEQKGELHVIVAPKIAKEEQPQDIVEVGPAKFLTPNETTKWRAETLLKKEPVTIDWLNQMQAGETLYDVGANVGGYTVWAGVRGVNVFAFEPEAENYALLVENIALNNLNSKAYCLAVTNKEQVDVLHMSTRGVGGSCHTFGESVDPFGEHRNGNHPEQACVGMSLDALIKKGLPQPDHLKIDVDGFEHKVIEGAKKTLEKVKSVLVEINPLLPEHKKLVGKMESLGFSYDPAQVEASTRKDGPFKGVAEYVFRRPDPIHEHLMNVLNQVKVESKPFPHFYLKDALPHEVFEQMVATLPKKYTNISKVRNTPYKHRFVAEPEAEVWQRVITALRSGEVKRMLCQRFHISSEGLTDETLLIRDKPGYSIGPHTDHPDKVISALFYLKGEEGTSLYIPREEGFTCAGGPHYSFNKFRKVKTMPFRPNSLFVFMKTDNSFHGVETTKHQRDLLLYDVRKR